MSSLETKIPPPIVMLIIAAAQWAIAGAPRIQLPHPVLAVVSFLLAAAGIMVELAGALYFLKARTTVDPIHPHTASKLVVAGLYRVTRNPMYLGDFLLLLGWATFLARPIAFAVAPLFVLYINRFQIKAEERALSERFGSQYNEYRERVRRWL